MVGSFKKILNPPSQLKKLDQNLISIPYMGIREANGLLGGQ